MDSDSSGRDILESQELWHQIVKRNRSALDTLFRTFYNSLFGYGIRVLGDEEIVKDCIQDLFLKVWNKSPELATPKSVKAYLLVSLRNLLVDQVRAMKHQKERYAVFSQEIFANEFSMEEVIFKNELDKQRKQELVKGLNQLNSKQKETIFLKYYHGLTNVEIAQVMGINYQSVKNNLSRAIQNLRGIVSKVSFSVLVLLLKSSPEWLDLS